MSRHSKFSYGWTGADYNRNLPKGISREVGDLFVEDGRVCQLADNPLGGLRLLDLRTGLFETITREHVLHMYHIAPGAALNVGNLTTYLETWKVIKVDGKQITVESATGQQRTVDVFDLATRLRERQQAHIEADMAIRKYRSLLRSTVAELLTAAGVEYSHVSSDTNHTRDGVVVSGVDKDALPETLVVLEVVADAVIVAVKPTPEQTVEAPQKPGPDDAFWVGDAKPEAATAAPPDEPTPPLALVKKPRVEIKTLVHIDSGDGFADFTIPDGWELITPVQYQLFQHPTSSAWQDATHIRYVTIKRTVAAE